MFLRKNTNDSLIVHVFGALLLNLKRETILNVEIKTVFGSVFPTLNNLETFNESSFFTVFKLVFVKFLCIAKLI